MFVVKKNTSSPNSIEMKRNNYVTKKIKELK